LDVKAFKFIGVGGERWLFGALAESSGRRERHVFETADGAHRLGVSLQSAEESSEGLVDSWSLLRRAANHHDDE
jgi:hypothetical protein